MQPGCPPCAVEMGACQEAVVRVTASMGKLAGDSADELRIASGSSCLLLLVLHGR